MQETAEQHIPVGTKPSWFGRITEMLRGRPKQTAETQPPIFPMPEPVIKPVEQIPESVTPAVPPVTEEPKIPRDVRRAAEKKAYEERKATTSQELKNTPPPVNAKPAVVARSAVAETSPNPANLPNGIKERERFSQGLLITKAEMPWLGEGDRIQVELDLMTLDTTKGEQFLYGSLIHGKKLNMLLRQMTQSELRSADNLLFVQLSELMQKRPAPDIRMLHNHLSFRRIFEAGNPRGIRVYFMRFDNLQGLPVIIRIAAAKDHKIMEVLSVISKENSRQTGSGGGR